MTSGHVDERLVVHRHAELHRPVAQALTRWSTGLNPRPPIGRAFGFSMKKVSWNAPCGPDQRSAKRKPTPYPSTVTLSRAGSFGDDFGRAAHQGGEGAAAGPFHPSLWITYEK
jgi:hypothetical protein